MGDVGAVVARAHRDRAPVEELPELLAARRDVRGQKAVDVQRELGELGRGGEVQGLGGLSVEAVERGAVRSRLGLEVGAERGHVRGFDRPRPA